MSTGPSTVSRRTFVACASAGAINRPTRTQAAQRWPPHFIFNTMVSLPYRHVSGQRGILPEGAASGRAGRGVPSSNEVGDRCNQLLRLVAVR